MLPKDFAESSQIFCVDLEIFSCQWNCLDSGQFFKHHPEHCEVYQKMLKFLQITPVFCRYRKIFFLFPVWFYGEKKNLWRNFWNLSRFFWVGHRFLGGAPSLTFRRKLEVRQKKRLEFDRINLCVPIFHRKRGYEI